MGRADSIPAIALAALAVMTQDGLAAPGAQVAVDQETIEQAIRSGNTAEAIAALEPAARAGDANAQYRLASLYLSAVSRGDNETRAFQWMKAAAGQGHVKA